MVIFSTGVPQRNAVVFGCVMVLVRTPEGLVVHLVRNGAVGCHPGWP